MRFSFAQYTTSASYSINYWLIDFFNDLSAYVTEHNREDGIQGICIGVIVVPAERAPERLFRPRRNQFIKYREFTGLDGQRYVLQDELLWEVQILSEGLLELPTPRERAAFIVGALVHSFEGIAPFVRRKKLRIDFRHLEGLMHTFVQESPGV